MYVLLLDRIFFSSKFVRIVFFLGEKCERVLRFISCSVINKSELFTICLATELFYIKMKKKRNFFWEKTNCIVSGSPCMTSRNFWLPFSCFFTKAFRHKIINLLPQRARRYFWKTPNNKEFFKRKMKVYALQYPRIPWFTFGRIRTNNYDINIHFLFRNKWYRQFQSFCWL